tara:strand:+ start:334 stop:867 length:534 start_codon:yes stop_codon:yes gene_type:complete
MKKRKKRKYKPLPPLEELKEYLDYNPDTGIFTWIKKPSHCIKVGQEAGGSNGSAGYIRIKFKGESYLAHRIAYYMYHGVDPLENFVDHEYGDRKNNKIKDLRLATVSQNGMNHIKLRSDNTSGVIGVHWRKDRKKWVSFICRDGVQKQLGEFTNKEDAIKAREEGEKKYHGRFRRKD